MTAVTRILAVGAMQGNEIVWRKFVNAVALDVFKIDRAVVLGALGVGGDERARWRALGDERLSDSEIPLTTVEVNHLLTLADGRLVPVATELDAIRAAVQRHRPALAICGGGPATAPHKFWIEDTLCVDPGSDAQRDGLSGYVVDLGERGVRVAQPVHA
ncbi:MAG TPA: hypothetical protein VHW04_04805 [Solirubrobacteraceae bacterium]|jgi:hypothetical protein|nr:hypothetical protein [Solirubrobacteraceae bacterium]